MILGNMEGETKEGEEAKRSCTDCMWQRKMIGQMKIIVLRQDFKN